MTKDEQWLLQEKYNGKKADGFFADCQRLAAGEPLAYVIGWVPFLDCKIWLDSKPLIPRPETEFWVSKAIEKIDQQSIPRAQPRAHQTPSNGRRPSQTLPSPNSRSLSVPAAAPSPELITTHQQHSDIASGSDLSVDADNSVKILDLCAGSGCVGVAVAKHITYARVDFGEIDAGHLPTIEKNLRENDIEPARCHISKSDLFTDIVGRYDFILTNPPYIDPVLDRTEASVTEHEPHQALYGGADGMEYIERIIAAAPAHLTPGGQLWIEHEPEQAQAIATCAAAHGFDCHLNHDQYKVARFSVLIVK